MLNELKVLAHTGRDADLSEVAGWVWSCLLPGKGETVLTPLALLFARADAGALTVAPLPGSRLSRQIELVAPQERLADIPLRVAEQSKRILANETLRR